jgi:hypothetical protein
MQASSRNKLQHGSQADYGGENPQLAAKPARASPRQAERTSKIHSLGGAILSKRKCSICAHAQAMEINSCLESGVRQKVIAPQFSVSKYALSRHVNRCLAPAPTANGDSTGGQIEKWLRRADDLYLAAGVNGDVKSQVQALSAAVRSLQAEQRNEAKRQEKEQDKSPTGVSPMEEMDAMDIIVEKYFDSCGDTKCFRCGAPNVAGRYVGTPEPGTFPALIAESRPEPKPEPKLRERHL